MGVDKLLVTADLVYVHDEMMKTRYGVMVCTGWTVRWSSVGYPEVFNERYMKSKVLVSQPKR
jgi:hypothetical protein